MHGMESEHEEWVRWGIYGREDLNARANFAGCIESQGRPRNAKMKHTQAPMRNVPKPSNLSGGQNEASSEIQTTIHIPSRQCETSLSLVGAHARSE